MQSSKDNSCEECYQSCIEQGFILKRDHVNIQRILSLIENAQISINQANIISKAIERSAREWMGVYTGYYDALRTYAEAYLFTQGLTSTNHQCLFAYLCRKSRLDLNWGFIETMRKKRNAANYYGEHILYEDWATVQKQCIAHIEILKQAVKSSIKQFD